MRVYMEILLFLSESRCKGKKLESRQKNNDLCSKKNFPTHSINSLITRLIPISDKSLSTFFFSASVNFLTAFRFPNSDPLPGLAVSG